MSAKLTTNLADDPENLYVALNLEPLTVAKRTVGIQYQPKIVTSEIGMQTDPVSTKAVRILNYFAYFFEMVTRKQVLLETEHGCVLDEPITCGLLCRRD